ncbi:hypothetical protein HDU92_006671 [Lobulomyces angularis]|nr:hypothetical protein HDU92_006671 [Lobulomyces angularis]
MLSNKLKSFFTLLSLTFTGVVSQAFCSTDSSEGFCVYSKENAQNVEFMMVGPTNIGWMAFGLGKSMSDAEMFIGYMDEGNATVSHRISTGYQLPTVSATPSVTLVPASSGLKEGKTVITFSVPKSRPMVNGHANPLDGTSTSLIFASGNSKVTSGSFSQHDKAHSSVSANLLAASSSFTEGQVPIAAEKPKSSSTTISMNLSLLLVFVFFKILNY